MRAWSKTWLTLGRDQSRSHMVTHAARAERQVCCSYLAAVNTTDGMALAVVEVDAL